MIPHVVNPRSELLVTVAGEAANEARWEMLEQSTRQPDELVDGLLAARAAELATSPIGRDQLLSRALEEVARIEPSAVICGDLLGPSPSEEERLLVRRRTLSCGGLLVCESEQVVTRIEMHHVEQLAERDAFQLLAACLLLDADLHELLWDDPRIPADDPTRMIMLRTVPKLRDRADQLGSSLHLRGWAV